MKKLSFLLVCFLLVLSLVACGNAPTPNNATITRANNNVTDMTRAFEKIDISNINSDNLIKAKSSPSFVCRCQTLEEIYDNSQYIVKGTVTDSYFTVIKGLPYNVVDVHIDDSITGSLNKGNIITILCYGGYMTVEQEVEHYDNASKFANIDKSKWKTTYIEEKLTDADYIAKGEEYVFCLLDNDISQGTYVPVNQFETIFKKVDNEYIRTLPSDDYFGNIENENAVSIDESNVTSDDSVTIFKDNKSFAFEDFKENCIKLKAKEASKK